MRTPIATALNAVSGVVFAAAGVALALWVGLAVHELERAFDWVLWAAEHSPVPLTAPPLELANAAIQKNSLIGAGVGAGLLLWIAYNALRGAARPVQAADPIPDASPRLVLKTKPAQIGQPLEGKVILMQDAKPGAVFQVHLLCMQFAAVGRMEKPAKALRRAVFAVAQERAAMPDGQTWSVPFRFEIPETAPASREEGIAVASIYRWEVRVTSANKGGLLPFEALLPLHVAPAVAGQPSNTPSEASTAQEELLGAVDALGTKVDRPLRASERAWLLRRLSPEALVGIGRMSAALGRLTKTQLLALAVVVVSSLVSLLAGMLRFVLNLF